jgi:hypothetical protein
MKDIKKEAQIPWCSKIHKIEVYNSNQQPQTSNLKDGECLLVPCPKCGKDLTEPLSKVETVFFKTEQHQCNRCGKRFEAIS